LIILIKNKGKSIFSTIILSLLCVAGTLTANYQGYNFAFPGFREEDQMFYLMILPFIIILIVAAIMHFTRGVLNNLNV